MWAKVADQVDLEPGEVVTVCVGHHELALSNVDGVFHALGDRCPHQGGSLGEGYLEGHRIVCPLHGWAFDVRTGEAAEPMQPGRVNVFPAKVEAGAVWVELPDDLG